MVMDISPSTGGATVTRYYPNRIDPRSDPTSRVTEVVVSFRMLRDVRLWKPTTRRTLQILLEGALVLREISSQRSKTVERELFT